MLANYLVSNFAQEDSILKIYPLAPVLSSRKAAWQSLNLCYYRLPPHETPEYYLTQYVICIHTGEPVTLKQKWRDGSNFLEKQVYGDVSIYPASYAVKEQWNAEADFIELYLDSTLFTLAACELAESDSLEIIPNPVVRDPLIQSIGLALKTELELSISENSTFKNRLYIESAANMLAIHLWKHYSVKQHKIPEYKGGLPNYKLKQVTEFINENLAEDFSLQEIAQKVGMSQHHFGRLFKKSTGLSPYQYVIECRIERAKHLLLQQKLSIADVALEVGFANQSHFTQYFKRFTGVTPKQYLR